MDELALERRDPVAGESAVGLDLRFARAPGPDAATESFEVGPQTAHPREVVFELRQLDLKLALSGVRVRGEDVEDDRRAVDHGYAQRLLEVSFLARRELVVTGDEVRVCAAQVGLQLVDLSGAEVRVRVRQIALLDELADRDDPGRQQQLTELVELLLAPARQRRDHVRTLTRASGQLPVRVGAGLIVASGSAPVQPDRW